MSVPQEPPRPEASEPPRRRIASTELLQGAKELIILHGEEEYRLRLTKNGKLILTK